MAKNRKKEKDKEKEKEKDKAKGKEKEKKKKKSGKALNKDIAEASAVLAADPSLDTTMWNVPEIGNGEESGADRNTAEKSHPHPYVNRKHLLNPSMTAQLAHGEQVSSLAYEVSLEMGLPADWSRDMIIAGFFHDIGKVILASNMDTDHMLVVEEMNSIRRHPTIGYEELKKKGYDQWICDAVRWHHENKDGSGYPDNLSDGEIPLGACILRVCDVFCALTQDRRYRKAFTPEEAMSMMVDEVEKYDIRVFLAFMRVIHRGPNGSIQIPEVRPEVEGVWKEL